MSIAEKSKKYFLHEDMNCAESLLRAANDEYSLNLDEHSLKLSGGFGGGLYVGATCGAICGAVMALSRLYNAERAHTSPILKEKTQEFMNKFEQEFEFFDCGVLKDRHYEEGSKCARLVETASSILDSVINT